MSGTGVAVAVGRVPASALARALVLILASALAGPGAAHDATHEGAHGTAHEREEEPHAGAAETAAPSGAPRFEPPPVGSYELPPIDRVSEHELLGASGAPAPLLDLEPGEAALVSFVYLSCSDACPMATATLVQIDRRLAQDPALASRVRLVTVSFDPARDTPARMHALAESLTPQGRWAFLTSGGPEALRPVLADFGQDAVWIPGGTEPQDRLRHVLKIFLVDDAHRVRNIYSTGLMDMRLMLNDLRTVLAEAGRSPSPSPSP